MAKRSTLPVAVAARWRGVERLVQPAAVPRRRPHSTRRPPPPATCCASPSTTAPGRPATPVDAAPSRTTATDAPGFWSETVGSTRSPHLTPPRRLDYVRVNAPPLPVGRIASTPTSCTRAGSHRRCRDPRSAIVSRLPTPGLLATLTTRGVGDGSGNPEALRPRHGSDDDVGAGRQPIVATGGAPAVLSPNAGRQAGGARALHGHGGSRDDPRATTAQYSCTCIQPGRSPSLRRRRSSCASRATPFGASSANA